MMAKCTSIIIFDDEDESRHIDTDPYNGFNESRNEDSVLSFRSRGMSFSVAFVSLSIPSLSRILTVLCLEDARS